MAVVGEPGLAEVEGFLRAVVAGLAPLAEPPSPFGWRGPGRPRVLPALALWAGLLVCVLRGFTGQTALWRLLHDGLLWEYPRFAVSDQAVFQRLARDGTAPLERLFGRVSALLARRLAPLAPPALAPFAAAVVALDATTLDRLARRLPALRGLPDGAAALLPGKLAGLFDLRTQQWRAIAPIPDAHENDKVSARDLAATLPAWSLILADLGYFGFAWFDWLTEHSYWWVSRLRAGTSYEVLHTYYRCGDILDAVVWLGAHRADRAAHAVRLVQFPVRGVLRRYLTNVRDPRVLAMADVARLYARRWDFELAVDLIKSHLHLHVLWSAKPVVVLQQVWAALIIAQILQALRLEIAARAGVDPFEVSLPLLVEWLPRYAAAGRDPLAAFVEHGRDLRSIRPSARTRVEAPDVPDDHLAPLPPDLVLARTPRYAQRKCGPRT